MLGQIKQGLRVAKTRAVDWLEKAVTTAIATVTPHNATAWFRHCGYLLSDTGTPEPLLHLERHNNASGSLRQPRRIARVRADYSNQST